MADGDLTVHQAIVEIINELGGIGKDGFNKEQGYNFRGIDQVLQHLHPLFAKYGVFVCPAFGDLIAEEVTAKSGAKGQRVRVLGHFMFYGPTGDWITVTTHGEALDYSDKATNKAMTAAFKYALFQVFAICDPIEDGDGYGEEGGRAVTGAFEYVVELLSNSGINRGTQQDIVQTAVGHSVRDLKELTDEELAMVAVAVESAIADLQQLENDDN